MLELGADEAIALYSYTARTAKEVSFNKGDPVTVFHRTNSDWWDARVNGKFGFVPVQYIKLIGKGSSVSDLDRKGSFQASSNLLSPVDEKSKPFQERVGTGNRGESPKSLEEYSGNVFASIDPTVTPGSVSPSVSRSSSTKSETRNPPTRSDSDSRLPPAQSRATRSKSPTGENDEQTKIKHQPSPKPMRVSHQDLAERKEEAVNPSGVITLPQRGKSVRERTKLFPNPILERPASAYARNPPSGIYNYESADRVDNVPSFKPPPPPVKPTKPKPKGTSHVKDELAATLVAAAAAKSNRQHVEKDQNTQF